LFCLQRKHLAMWVLLNIVFHGEVLLASRPTPKLDPYIRKHILCTIAFSPKSFLVWDKVKIKEVEPDRLQMTIRGMRTACWIDKATEIPIVLPRHQWLRERASVLFSYARCLSWTFLQSIHTSSGDHPDSYSMYTYIAAALPGVERDQGVKLTNSGKVRNGLTF